MRLFDDLHLRMKMGLDLDAVSEAIHITCMLYHSYF